jgi:hypothetical protein
MQLLSRPQQPEAACINQPQPDFPMLTKQISFTGVSPWLCMIKLQTHLIQSQWHFHEMGPVFGLATTEASPGPKRGQGREKGGCLAGHETRHGHQDGRLGQSLSISSNARYTKKTGGSMGGCMVHGGIRGTQLHELYGKASGELRHPKGTCGYGGKRT